PSAEPPVPAPRSSIRRARRGWVAALAIFAGLTVAGVGHYVRHPRSVAPQNAPLVLGVMAIRSRDAQVAPWMRELTRDALNTTLSKVHGLQVYSRQKIDFLREK